MMAATRKSKSALSRAGVFLQVLNSFAASSTARLASSLVALLKRPTSCVRLAGLKLSSLLSVVIRSPPITSGYSRPSCDFTFSIASRIACAFSSLLKSVNGSSRNSEGINSLQILGFEDSTTGAGAAGRSRKVRSRSRRQEQEKKAPRIPWLSCLLLLLLFLAPLACFLQFFDLAFDELAF